MGRQSLPITSVNCRQRINIDEFRLYPNPTDTPDLQAFLDKYKKRYGKQSKSVTKTQGYGSEENYEYLEDGRNDGLCKVQLVSQGTA